MNQTALITGASRGLGAELAGFLASQDYRLILTARDPASLEMTARKLTDRGAQVTALAGDVTNADHRRRLGEAAERAGGLDLLINNASELGPSPLPELAAMPLDAFDRILDVNVIAPLGLIQTALPALKKRSGLVVNVSSDAAVGAYPGWGGYGASKSALELMSATLAAELGETGVAVVAVDPGDMRTAMHQAAFPGDDISDRPLPSVTVPFWAWLLGQERSQVNGRRFGAQDAVWRAAS